MRIKPLNAEDGINAETFMTENPSWFEPDPKHGSVQLKCSICGRKMRPFALVRADEPTTKLRARIWIMRRWLELPWEGSAYCPRHLPQHTFWHHSFDFSEEKSVVKPKRFQKTDPQIAQDSHAVLF